MARIQARMGWFWLLASLVGAVLGGAVVFSSCFSTVEPRAELSDDRLRRMREFDYGGWTHVLRRFVDGRGRVDYDALHRERSELDRFIALIARVGPKSRPELFPDRDHRLAYYINAYNALVLFNVINRYPGIDSVADDKKDFFYFTRFRLDGEKLSLYALENNIVRGRFHEPRVHFALNCASASCPALPRQPFLPRSLAGQLARETRSFLHQRRNVAVSDGTLVLSEIFDWYRADFEPDPVAWIRRLAPDLAIPHDVRVRYRDYDWALNARPHHERGTGHRASR